MNEYIVTTYFTMNVKDSSESEAETIAMHDLEKRVGLGGNWSWREDVDAKIIKKED